MGKKHFFFQFLFSKIECLTSSYHLSCTCVLGKRKPKYDIFICDYVLFLKNKIRNIFELEYMCSFFTFVWYITCSNLLHNVNPFPNKPWFLRVSSTSLLKTSNFSFSHSVFYPFRKLSSILIKFKIVVCKLIHFGPV